MKRRDMLKTLGAMVGAAGAAKLLTACGGSDGDKVSGIDTFVFLMMENRSYDHYLGARAFEGKPGDGLVTGMSNPTTGGASEKIWLATEPTMCLEDPPHGWSSSHAQWNNGANDGFVRAYEASAGTGARGAMQYLDRAQLPVHYALADSYTNCDRWFSSVMGPTQPNRAYWLAGHSLGHNNNDDIIGADWKDTPLVYTRLDEAGIDWAIYYSDVPEIALFDGAPIGDGRLRRVNYDFWDEAAAGTLPNVVYIDPAFGGNDDHPPKHPLMGQQFIAAVYQALATSPQWENCMLVITYDEHGGFFDHVAPPKTMDDYADRGFDQLGFRVPSLVIGPYAKQGYVSSVQYDHTSVLKHLQNVYGIGSLGARTAAANDLTDCIDMERLAAGDPAPPITLPAVEIDESELPDHCKGSSLGPGPVDHIVLQYADTHDLGKHDRRAHTRDYLYDIAAYLDKHNLGRIKRGS